MVVRRARILVVDDEPGMIRAVERVLSEDHHVIGTRLSRDALSVANEFHPELAIVDIRMPDLDGFELMAQLKARFPALDVILMTGSVDDLDEKLVRAIRSQAFYFIQKPFDREVMRTLVERCVELRRRREDHRQTLKRLETEMAEARAFQQSLLPDREATLHRVALCCRYTPCSALGGDLYDYAATAGRTALLIADVSGHGVSAAMLTGIVKSAFHASHVDGFEPSAVVERVSMGLAAFSPDRFVTLVAALISPDERQLRYVNAGHPPIVLWGNRREPRWLASTGPLVSPVLRRRSTWHAPAVPMDEGDHLLLYTDGVSETLADADGRAEKRFERAIDQALAGGAALLDTILDDVHHELAGQPQPDDLTLLTASVLPINL
jgi:phosphoserine phosphatase RsbU/P